jgi:tetratricopeptide (TPR) repeat protein
MMVFLMAFSASPLKADTSAEPLPSKESILQKARDGIDQNQNNPAGLRGIISTLEGYVPRFPDEVRFPLYLAEAYYRVADPGADVNREFPYYEKTGAYAQRVLEMDPNRPEGHYWHGLFLLKKAQKRGITGYFIVKEGIKELEQVRQSLPAYDHAGASRVLGLLYCLAPGWSPFGDLDKSVNLAKEATRLAPDYVLNRLYLADAYKKRGDKEAAVREYLKVIADSSHLPEAEGFSQRASAMLLALGHSI